MAETFLNKKETYNKTFLRHTNILWEQSLLKKEIQAVEHQRVSEQVLNQIQDNSCRIAVTATPDVYVCVCKVY